MLREEQIMKMMDKTVSIIDSFEGHTVDECLHMIAAAVGVMLLQEKDIQAREEIVQELIRIIRTSVYESSDEEVVYVDRVIEE
jgi:hypothetical protein|tara:strand:- start:414 stop:662 length:249 start_codon:yes stop_codon:yes gene_type:complete